MISLFVLDPDPGVLAMHYLALTLWPMGDIGRAVSLVGRAEARIADLTVARSRLEECTRPCLT